MAIDVPPTPTDDTTAAERELDRVGAFSDGVFAIAITLLVLNIDVPDVPGHDLGHAIRELSGSLEAYAIGFAVMGLFWYQHHRLFSRLTRASGRLVLVNTALLAAVALMPFTLAVMGRYDEPLAVTLYAVNVGATILLNGALHEIAKRSRLLVADARRYGHTFLRGTLPRVGVFALSIVLAYGISPSLAKWSWLLLLAVPAVFERERD